MLVLAAVTSTFTASPGEQQFALAGELVSPVALGCANRHCETCASSWFGLTSHAPTTMAIVVDRPGVTEADLRRGVHAWLDSLGRIDVIMQACESDDRFEGLDPVAWVAEIVDEHVEDIRAICEGFAAGTIVSRLGSLVSPRLTALAA